MKNARAFAFSETGNGARTGKKAVVIKIPRPRPMKTWYPIYFPRLVSASQVKSNMPETIRDVQARNSWGLYLPNFATLIPEMRPKGMIVHPRPRMSMPDPNAEANLHAWKYTAR